MVKNLILYWQLLFIVIVISNSCYASDHPFISEKLVGIFEGEDLVKAFNDIDPIASTIINTPKCEVEVYKITYQTKGARGEKTTSTAAVMIPSGNSLLCKAKHPILLHAHGTTGDQVYDFSQVANPDNPAAYRSTNFAINFASQGYIVIAPNYAGYDESLLSYHPYLSSQQQATEMYDAYVAADHFLKRRRIKTSNKIFISGYSQGGYVALATSRLFRSYGKKVTAVAPMSGPYALLAFGDHIFKGNINLGADFFIPLLILNYQKEYGNDYINIYDIFQKDFLTSMQENSNGHWSEGLENLPKGVFKPIALNEYSRYGFDNSDYLVSTEFRKDYLYDTINNPDFSNDNKFKTTPKNRLRQILKKNDLRDYIPDIPIFLCGGNQDPVVYYDINTVMLYEAWNSNRLDNFELLDVTVLDVDMSNLVYRKQKPLLFFGKAKSNNRNMKKVSENIHKNFLSMFEKEQNDPESLKYIYHSNLVAPNCINATKEYFDSF